MKILTAVVFVAAVGLLVPAQAAEPEDVTMLQLIANPSKFDGQVIRVTGFLNLEFEGNVLYLHKDHPV